MTHTLKTLMAATALSVTAIVSPAIAEVPQGTSGGGFPTTPELERAIAAIPVVENRDIADPSALTVDEAAFAAQFSHYRVPVGDQRVHFVMGGDGPALLLLHGWPTSWYEWKRMMPLLAENYTVIAPDLPGVGRSSGASYGGRKQPMAQTMIDLMTQLGHDDFYVVGHDWGTSVAWAMGYLAPERIPNMIISENTIPGLDVPGLASWGEFNSMWWHHTFHAAADIPEMLVQGRERAYLDSKYREWVFNYEETFGPEFLDVFVDAYTGPGNLTGGFNLYRSIKDDAADNRRSLTEHSSYPIPLLIVTARYQVNEFLHRQVIPHANDVHSVKIDNAQHFLSIETPLTFTALVEDFLPDGDLDSVAGAKVVQE